MSKVTPFLMFSDRLDDALAFYRTLFPDIEVHALARAGEDGPVQTAEFTMGGQSFKAYVGGPHFSFSEGVSLFVDCEAQAEVDRFWERILDAGGTESKCGWITDPFGLSWQIVPRGFMDLIGGPDPKKAKAAFEAMLKMAKLDLATLQRAYADA